MRPINNILGESREEWLKIYNARIKFLRISRDSTMGQL